MANFDVGSIGSSSSTAIIIISAIAVVVFIFLSVKFPTFRKVFGGIFLAAGIVMAGLGVFRATSTESRLIRAFGGSDEEMIALFVCGGILLVFGIILLAVGSSKKNTYYSQMQNPINQPQMNQYPPVNQGPQYNQPIMVRCTACQSLNDESSRFCQNCGNQLKA
ncbi:MAG: DUF3185 family protein [Bacillota bacterium]|nr:DUF3185 family protein [Bacillota bacterium]